MRVLPQAMPHETGADGTCDDAALLDVCRASAIWPGNGRLPGGVAASRLGVFGVGWADGGLNGPLYTNTVKSGTGLVAGRGSADGDVWLHWVESP